MNRGKGGRGVSAVRLIKVITALASGRRYTAKELAERYEVSTRTIRRDAVLIHEIGIPVNVMTENGGTQLWIEGHWVKWFQRIAERKESHGIQR